VAVAAALGSFIAGVALVWYNYRVLGYPKLAWRTAIAGGIFYAMVMVAAAMAPNTPIVGVAVLIGQSLVAAAATRALQGSAIEWHVAHGGAMHGTGMAGLVGLGVGIGAALLLILVGNLFGLPIGLVSTPSA
jgi:ABC-type Na+ efflux pump permease subunit